MDIYKNCDWDRRSENRGTLNYHLMYHFNAKNDQKEVRFLINNKTKVNVMRVDIISPVYQNSLHAQTEHRTKYTYTKILHTQEVINSLLQ